jgi:hypothetical protein
MTTTTSVHAAIMAALTGAGVAAVYGPADDLPVAVDGLLAQAAVLWPAPRLNTYTRMVGTRSGGADRIVITCVGATARDALAVADKVEAAIGGMVLSAKGGTLRQTAATSPVPEPNADPVRVSLAVEYSTITKG